MPRRLLRWALLPLLLVWSLAPAAQTTLPNRADSLKFAVIGDMGTGGRRQLETADRMAAVQSTFPFSLVITVGDNIYGDEDPEDMQEKFSLPYKALLDRGVTFHASLGNHDELTQRFYHPFNMNGQRYYTFTRGPVQFFALDTTEMTAAQLNWFDQVLDASTAPWKVAYFHHPLYSSGRRHGPTEELQTALEPLFGTYGVQVVFSGHEHFYERLRPVLGTHYFISGAGGQLRKDNISPGPQKAAGFDDDNSFLVVEVAGDEMYVEAIAREGQTVDSTVINRTNGTSGIR